MRLIQAAINGTRTRAEHPGIPVTPVEQAREAAAAVLAGAGAIHVHVRRADERESLDADDVARSLEAIRAACPGIPVGVSTGAWIVSDPAIRLALMEAWEVQPDFASVNLSEDGALDVIRLLLSRGVGVEAGIWNASSARTLTGSGLADECLRVLLEPAEAVGDPLANLAGIEAVLGPVRRPTLLHGFGDSAWELVALAAKRGFDTRTGFEDTLTLPDGSRAESNADMVTAASRIVVGT